MAVDLHPDIVRAINNFASTPMGRKYGRFAKKRYGVSGKKLMAKTVAGEFGGRSTKSGRGIVSSAGARGPAQFIPSTRAGYIQQYGVDPWKDDASAIKGMAIHHMGTGVEGYNPGMPTYKDYILGQKINPDDIRALRTGSGAGGGGGRRSGGRPGQLSVRETVTPGVSYEAERQDLRRSLLLQKGGPTMAALLQYAQEKNALQDVPEKRETNIRVRPGTRGRSRGGKLKPRNGVPQGYKGKKGGIYEVFYDPAGEYWDSGGIRKGAIGGHSDHVHVSADRGYIVKIGKFAQRLGLHVGEQRRFGGTPTGGHTSGSYHYRDMGIDVSGDPKKMAEFARIMRNEARRGHGR